MNIRTLRSIAVVAALAFNAKLPLSAHCDTMNGPVVVAARAALESGDVAPVLKWVLKESESEVRSALARTLKVRTAGREARELADSFFFETVVRLHRAGEGEPYNGLKAGTEVDPAVAAADEALRNGSPDALVSIMTEKVSAEIRQRFERASRARRRAEQSVEAGRQYVAAYVDLMHYLEHVDTASGRHEEEHNTRGATQ